MASSPPIFNRIYDYEYFDDTDMLIYIGDVWVDEITSLSYSCVQEKTPIYGYASQLFDTTAAGHVIVQGQFSINYKEQGYLWAVLRRWFDMGPNAIASIYPNYLDPAAQNLSKKLISGKIEPGSGGRGSRPVVGANATKTSRASIERLAQGASSKQERYSFYQSLVANSTFSVKSPKDKVFEDIVEAFEDEIWKTTDNEPLLNQIRRTDDNAFDGFDIYVSFGNYANPRANHTVQKIIGVRLIGQAKSIEVGQGAVQEVYQFIAQAVA